MGTISRITVWNSGDTLTAAALNGEFNNIVNDYNGNITNANLSGSAALSYSKLALTGSIVNADISASAAIAVSKINTGVSGSLVGTSDTQTLTNKDLSSSTNTLPSPNIYSYSTTTGPSTSSTSYVSIDGSNLTHSLTTTNSHKVLITFNSEISNNNTGNPLDSFRIQRDGVTIAQMTSQADNPSILRNIAFCFIDSPTTGAHSYDVQWKTTAGTLSTLGQGGTLTFSLQELII